MQVCSQSFLILVPVFEGGTIIVIPISEMMKLRSKGIKRPTQGGLSQQVIDLSPHTLPLKVQSSTNRIHSLWEFVGNAESWASRRPTESEFVL